MRCMHPAVVPFHYAILYMIQSGTYILSPDFVSNFKKIALNEALILWKMTFVPTDVKLHDVMALLFNPLSYGKKVLTTVFSIVFLKNSFLFFTAYLGVTAIFHCWAAQIGH